MNQSQIQAVDAVLRIAHDIYIQPKVYALLIGSGVSRAADIPTGWGITLDLIQRLASMLGEEAEPKPEEWYSQKFGSEPDYSEILERLAKTTGERQAILRAYFEPSIGDDEEADAANSELYGPKKPTRAHRAIAKLVRKGYIRV